MDVCHGRTSDDSGPASVSLPGSKSLTNRALIAASLADGVSVLRGVLLADDTRLMIGALRALGVAITVDDGGSDTRSGDPSERRVDNPTDKPVRENEPRALADAGNESPPPGAVNQQTPNTPIVEVTGSRGHILVDRADIACGNAGTVMRFVTAVVCLGNGRYRLDGVERMRQRPMGGLTRVVQSLGVGVEFEDRDGYPPLVVHAKGLRGGYVSFDSPESSQMVSALLLAGPLARGDLFIDVTGDIHSVPYLKMTVALMRQFGVVVIEQYEPGGAKFIIEGSQRYQATNLTIEPDASNATYFLAVPAVVGGRVSVPGLGTDSVQGDARFVDVLERMGCTIERAPGQLTVLGPPPGAKLQGIDVDLNDMPDTVQTLAVLALFADGPTTIRNVANLRVKETDRIAALRTELTKLGATVEAFDDGLRITPPASITPAAIDTYNDHRMAMSFALARLKVPEVVINNPECCAKTFPDFFERFGVLATR